MKTIFNRVIASYCLPHPRIRRPGYYARYGTPCWTIIIYDYREQSDMVVSMSQDRISGYLADKGMMISTDISLVAHVSL